MPEIALKYGSSEVTLDVPEHNLCGVLEPSDLPALGNPGLEIERALAHPIGSPPLRELAAGKGRVVILVSDITRPSPSRLMLPPILQELQRAGLKYSQIRVVFALGYPRCHNEEEKRFLLGEEVFSRVEAIDHDVNRCVYIGTTGQGTPVEVFEPVAQADLVIATGNIELHYKAGYTGGNKALLPGCCSARSIAANHSLMMSCEAGPGIIDGNPMRRDIEEAGRLARVAFIVNVVLNSRKEVVKVVAGDPILAHRAGVSAVDEMYKRKLATPANIVVASCGGMPKDINMYQAQKALENASRAVTHGGTIILVAECREGLGERTFAEWMVSSTSPDEPIERLKLGFRLGAHKAAILCQVLRQTEVYLVSSMPADLVKKIFMKPASTVQEALAQALERHGMKARVLVMPHAESTLPVLSGS